MSPLRPALVPEQIADLARRTRSARIDPLEGPANTRSAFHARQRSGGRATARLLRDRLYAGARAGLVALHDGWSADVPWPRRLRRRRRRALFLGQRGTQLCAG